MGLSSTGNSDKEWAYLQLEIPIKSLVRRMFRLLGRPFEAIRADDAVSRRDEVDFCLGSSPCGVRSCNQSYNYLIQRHSLCPN